MKDADEETEGLKSWLVAIGCCVINCLLITPFRLAGLIFVELIDKYNIDRSKASTPMFVFAFATNMAGPLIGLIGKKIGAENIVLLGCLIASIGIGANFFSENIITVVAFLGLFYGIGFSASANVLPNILQKHFKKNYNSASGIFNSGACFAGFIFPSIAVILFRTYGLSGSLLILSGIIINSVPVAMLIKKASSKTPKISMKNKALGEKITVINKTSDTLSSDEKLGNILLETHQSSILEEQSLFIPINNYRSLDESTNVTEKILHEDLPQTRFAQESGTVQIAKAISSSIPSICLEQSFCNKDCNTPNLSLNHPTKCADSQIYYLKVKALEKPLQQNESLFPKNSNKQNKSSYGTLLKKLFLNPSFWILVILNSFCLYFMTIVRSTLIDYSRDKGIQIEYEAYILMIQAVFDMIGRLSLVWVVDKGFMSSTTFTILSFLSIAIAMGGIIFSKGITTLIIAASISEVGTGTITTILPGMIIEFLEEDEIIVAMPSRLFLFVPMSFTSYPLIDYFRNQLKSYDKLYCLLIAFCLVCALITPLTARYSKKQRYK